ncbi:hypothetical protein BD779DRAFT_1671523 [Infundibulicybe gibba]|nr:hypothetical protein BD779DRAFT_1671523 [Infundibulicybe gibba]
MDHRSLLLPRSPAFLYCSHVFIRLSNTHATTFSLPVATLEDQDPQRLPQPQASTHGLAVLRDSVISLQGQHVDDASWARVILRTAEPTPSGNAASYTAFHQRAAHTLASLPLLLPCSSNSLQSYTRARTSVSPPVLYRAPVGLASISREGDPKVSVAERCAGEGVRCVMRRAQGYWRFPRGDLQGDAQCPWA